MKKYLPLIGLLLLLFLVSCTAGRNPAEGTIGGSVDKVAGFWLGLWHGIISPVTFIISLFDKNIHFYEVHNNGGWYNFGFLLGACITLGGGGKASSRRK